MNNDERTTNWVIGFVALAILVIAIAWLVIGNTSVGVPGPDATSTGSSTVPL